MVIWHKVWHLLYSNVLDIYQGGKWEKSKLEISGILIFAHHDEHRVTPALRGNGSVDLLHKLQLQERTASHVRIFRDVCHEDTSKVNADQSRACLKNTLGKCHCIKIRLLTAASASHLKRFQTPLWLPCLAAAIFNIEVTLSLYCTHTFSDH